MSAGTPVLSTSLGAEGLEITHGSDILLAEEPDSWVRALELTSDPSFRSGLVERARELACNRYDWNIIGSKLNEIYRRWAYNLQTEPEPSAT
jgi:glycosyltransferase involved in cell wall biosynthesis